MFCTNCGTQCENVNVCPNCGNVLNAEPTVADAATEVTFAEPGAAAPAAAPAKKSFNIKKLIPVIAIVLVVAIVAGIVGIAGLAQKPTAKLASAVEKLAFDTESLTFSIKTDYGEEYEGAIAFGKDVASSSFYFNVSEDNEDYMSVVSNNGELVYWMDGYYGTAIKANLPKLYDYALKNKDEMAEMQGWDDYADMSSDFEDEFGIAGDQAINWLESIISGKKINENTLEDIYNTVLRPQMADEMDEDEKVIPDYKTMKKILVGFIAKGLDEEAVEVIDKSTKDGVKMYKVKVDPTEVARCLYEYVQDNRDLKAFLKTEAGEDFLDELEYLKDEDYGSKIKFTFGIKGGRLAYLEGDGVKITLGDFNKSFDFEKQYKSVEDNSDEWSEIEDLEEFFYGF